MTTIQISDGLGFKALIDTSMTQIPKIQHAVREWKSLNYVSDKRFGRANPLLAFLRHRNVRYNLSNGKPDLYINL